LSALKKLFKHTFIYGIATVLPRVLGLILTPLYIVKLPKADFGIYISLMVYLILGNVLLSYGMETAFFRFMNKGVAKTKVSATALTSVFFSSTLFLIIALLFKNKLSIWLNYEVEFIIYAILILFLDALVVIPFAWFRNKERPIRYSTIKILNVSINLSFNLFFFLALPVLSKGETNSFLEAVTFENKVHYIFISNLIASLITLLLLAPLYFKIGFKLDKVLWKKMLYYAFPVLIAGIAFSINEGVDKLFLRYLLPKEIADTQVAIYGGCYKLGVFMTLFITAFKLGVEPFFFSQANKQNAKNTYANITLYFSIFGAFILLFVVVFIDLLKLILVPEKSYWEALWIVPIILMANLCLGIYHNLSVWYKITDQTKFGAYISVFGAIITLVLNLLLIPVIGFKGAAIATLAAYASMMLLSYYFGQRKYPIPYNLRKIGLYLGTSVLFSFLSFYVFNSNIIIGSSFLLVFLILIYISEKTILKSILIKK